MCAGIALRQLARNATAIYEEHLKPTGLKLTQYSVLAKLDRLAESSLVELADACKLDITSLSRAMRPLQRSGLIEVSSGKDDRTKCYRLSSKGRRTVARAFVLWQKAQDELHRMIAPEQMRALSEISDKAYRAASLRKRRST